MKPKERQAFIEDLRHTLSVAGLNMEVWVVLTARDFRTRHLRTMNGYGIFFQTSINAHFVGMLIPFYRLYEIRSDTFNVPRLLKELRESGALPTDKLDELDGKCAAIRPLWIKVSILRNKAFGHRNAALTLKEIFCQAAISQNQFHELFEKTKELLNTLTLALNREVHAFNLGSGDSLNRMLEDLGRVRE
jgi:hypothetical protein